jgi:outer membrane protein OmpA-like peptidoglycan-associated protein
MVQFAGYKVEKGKMNLDLQYKVDNKELVASNNLMIDQFELGDKVENPNAVSLPLKLAVALLKDANGKIKLDVPITGSLDDPKFSISTIVTDALFNVLSKVVTAPFRALGSLFGSEKEMSTVSFSAGSSTLNEKQQAKLKSLAEQLNKHPELNLDIKGAAYQEQDWPVIRGDALYDQLKKRRAIELNKGTDKKIREEYVELSDDDYKRLLADMFIEKFPLLAEKSFLGTPKLMNPSAGDFYEIAKQKLFAVIKVQPQRLKVLAVARAQAIANYMVQKGGVTIEKIFILDTALDPVRDNKEIISYLSLNAN